MTPSNPDAERALLAAMLADPDGALIDQAVAAGLRRESFYEWHHGAVFASILRARGEDRLPDTVSVCHDLAASGEIGRVGGPAGVDAIAGSSYSILHFKNHLELVLCAATQRAALKHLLDAQENLGREYLTREDLHTAMAPDLARVENVLQQQDRVRSLSAAVREASEKAEARITNMEDTSASITTGIHEFDKYASPIGNHELVVIAARPSVGKSSLARQIAWHAVKQGKRVAAFLLETSDTSFVEGCAAQEARVSVRGLREYPRDRIEAYRLALAGLSKSRFLRLYDRDLSIDAIESRCRVLRTAFRPELVIVDYLQIIRGRNPKVSTADAIGEITGRFVGMVKLLGCPVIVMSQLNRGQERENNRQPVLSDLRDSGSIEADAHRVIFIHRPTMDRSGVRQNDDAYREVYDCELVQAKLRDGGKCCIGVKFHAPWATFE